MPEEEHLQYGRFINHGTKKERNAKVKVEDNDGHGMPILNIFALREIEPDEEILYDYGIKEFPWVSKK